MNVTFDLFSKCFAHTLNSEIFAIKFIFAKRIKRHICDVKHSRLGNDLPISVNKEILLFREGLIFTKLAHAKFRENKTLAKIFELNLHIDTISIDMFMLFEGVTGGMLKIMMHFCPLRLC